MVWRTGLADNLSHQARDRDVRERARDSARLRSWNGVRDHRWGWQGRAQPGQRADREGPRGDPDRVLALVLSGDRGGVRTRRAVLRRHRAVGTGALWDSARG